MKYVVVSGGVVSGLGKGVTASSIGVVLKSCGLRVTSIKIDPYLNTDAGTMSPFEHGEVFVLDDGGEASSLGVSGDSLHQKAHLHKKKKDSLLLIESMKIECVIISRSCRGKSRFLAKVAKTSVTKARSLWKHNKNFSQGRRLCNKSKIVVETRREFKRANKVDLDLGNYERFLDVTLTRENNITTGKIYQSVIDKERRGDYLGKTVQVVPHITDAIKNWIQSVSLIPVDGKDGPADVCVIELGGTVGDIESMPFIEALRQLSYSVGQENFCLVHVSLVPVLGVVGEQKTKPTQHSVRELRALGLTPHLLACRSAQPLLHSVKAKLSQFCHVPAENIVTIHDVPNIWHIPLLLRSQNVHDAILKQLKFPRVSLPPDLQEWTKRAETYDNLTEPVKIAMVGKYTGLSDSYLSVVKALLHACIACSLKPQVEWIAASDLEDESAKAAPEARAAAWETLRNAAGILVPGGFGDRGVKGMILATKFARENRVPYLGICLGMQISVIEFAQSVLSLERANSTEFDPETPDPVVIFMPEGSRTQMGNTMRLGSRRTFFQTSNSIASKLYQKSDYVDERHRHRYEVNPDYIERLEDAGLKFVGRDESGRRMEIVELPDHPYYVGVQFHPEFKSRPGRPSALFLGLILAATGQLQEYLREQCESNSKHEI